MKQLLKLLLLLFPTSIFAQVNGGEHIFEFLRLSQNPHTTALGGISVANVANDVMLTNGNPALLKPSMHTQLSMNYQLYYAGSKILNVMYAHYNPRLKTTFSVGMYNINYGSFSLTDDIGNTNGTQHAVDYTFHVAASRKYLEKWRYGATLKYVRSNLINKKASAIVTDLGLNYIDTSNKFYAGLVIKNAGVVVKNYEKGIHQPLPLDVQLGFAKKFKKAPFTIQVLGHHLYEWDIRYNNPADVVNNTLLFNDTTTTTKTKTYFADKLFRHMVFALDVNLGKRLEISAGYNHLRRSELSIAEKKGASGFSYGVGLYLNAFTVHFAQSFYHIAGPTTQFGISMKLNKLFGFGTFNDKIKWSEKFTE